MMTSRALRDDIQNALDFLFAAELALYINPVSDTPTRISWQPFGSEEALLISYGATTIEQYLAWVRAGAYSLVLRDGGLLQLTYSFKDRSLVGHRLAYVPCPVVLDEELLEE